MIFELFPFRLLNTLDADSSGGVRFYLFQVETAPTFHHILPKPDFLLCIFAFRICMG